MAELRREEEELLQPLVAELDEADVAQTRKLLARIVAIQRDYAGKRAAAESRLEYLDPPPAAAETQGEPMA